MEYVYMTVTHFWQYIFVVSFPGLPCFCSLVSVQYNKWSLPLLCIILNTNRSTKRGRPGNEANIFVLVTESKKRIVMYFKFASF